MLSSVPELQGYIDKSQLTEDLGGTLDYCHSRWLCHRTVSPPGPPAITPLGDSCSQALFPFS